jgi:hypothetical protein
MGRGSAVGRYSRRWTALQADVIDACPLSFEGSVDGRFLPGP